MQSQPCRHCGTDLSQVKIAPGAEHFLATLDGKHVVVCMVGYQACAPWMRTGNLSGRTLK